MRLSTPDHPLELFKKCMTTKSGRNKIAVSMVKPMEFRSFNAGLPAFLAQDTVLECPHTFPIRSTLYMIEDPLVEINQFQARVVREIKKWCNQLLTDAWMDMASPVEGLPAGDPGTSRKLLCSPHGYSYLRERHQKLVYPIVSREMLHMGYMGEFGGCGEFPIYLAPVPDNMLLTIPSPDELGHVNGGINLREEEVEDDDLIGFIGEARLGFKLHPGTSVYRYTFPEDHVVTE